MDFHLPGDNGLKVARQIMETKPVPIIIVSATWTDDQFSRAFELMDAGAVGTVRRPAAGHPDYEPSARALRQLVKSMSEIKVVKRSARFKPKSAESALIPTWGKRSSPSVHPPADRPSGNHFGQPGRHRIPTQY